MESKNKIHLYAFEKLEVYQLAMQYSVMLGSVLNGFPPEEKYGLTSQLRRSAYSISANVAEGSGRASSADRAHFTNIAYCSALETIRANASNFFRHCEAVWACASRSNLLIDDEICLPAVAGFAPTQFPALLLAMTIFF